jgi:hypothetical protein
MRTHVQSVAVGMVTVAGLALAVVVSAIARV